MVRTKLSLLACVTVGFLAATQPAFAADAKKPAASAKAASPAEAAFRAGKKLFEAGNFHDAAEKLDESYRLEPKLAKLLLLATAHDKEGRSATAWDEYKRVLADASKANNKKIAEASRKLIADVYKRLSYIKLDAIPASATTIEIDSKLIDKSGWNTPQPFDPGQHDVKISSAAGKSKTVSMTLQPGPITQSLALPPLEGDAPTTPVATNGPAIPADSASPPPSTDTASNTATTDSPKKTSGGRIAAYVLGGAGIAGVGVGSVFGVIALGDKSTVSKHCGVNAGSSGTLTNSATACDPQGFKAESDGRTAGNISTVAMAVGGAALVTGVVLFFLTGPSKAEKTGFRVTPTIPLSGSGAYGIEVGGAF